MLTGMAEMEFRGFNGPVMDIELGSIPAGEVTERRLKILNRTKNSWSIDRVEVSCGCIRVKSESNTLAAGGEIELRLSVAPTTVTDDFKQEVRLAVTGEQKHIRFFVTGKAFGKARLSPMQLRFNAPDERTNFRPVSRTHPDDASLSTSL